MARHENGEPAPKHGQYLDHNNALGTWTHALLTARHSARTGSLGGTCGNSSHRRRMLRALENRTQTADYPSRITTRSHANSLELAQLTTASENQTVSRGVTNEVNFCKRLKTHLSKSNRSSKQYEIRHTTHNWALWVGCMREFARTFFSLHCTSKRERDHAQNATVGTTSQAGFSTSNPQMTDETVWETFGNLTDCS